MYFLLYVLPKNLLSFVVGVIARCPLPVALRAPLFRAFANYTGAALEEAGAPLESYASLGAFFVRELKPGLRPVGPDIVSPADGTLRECGPIDANTLLQGKGLRYSLQDLLPNCEEAAAFVGGASATIYLAPKNYHRVHMPVDGEVYKIVTVPGTLWPVNQWSVERIPKLFCVNERMVFFIRSEVGLAAVVMVGATNVGSISTPLAPVQTNTFGRAIAFDTAFGRSAPPIQTLLPNIKLAKGELLGTFHLGSTAIVLLEKSYSPVRFSEEFGPTRVGETLAIQLIEHSNLPRSMSAE